MLWCLNVSGMKLEMKQDWSCIEVMWQIVMWTLYRSANFSVLGVSEEIKKKMLLHIFTVSFELWHCLEASTEIFIQYFSYNTLHTCVRPTYVLLDIQSTFYHTVLPPSWKFTWTCPDPCKMVLDNHIMQELHGMEKNSLDF